MNRAIDFAKYRIRTCRSLCWCDVCDQGITVGQEYHDGGYGRRAHVACVHIVVQPKVRGINGGDIAGGADVDDADREATNLEKVGRWRSIPDGLRRDYTGPWMLREEVLPAVNRDIEDAVKPALIMLATLCSAIETHHIDQVNEYVENARKRARDFLEANGHGPKEAPACADCEKQNCDADATGKCPITGEEADDGYNTVGEGDHLL